MSDSTRSRQVPSYRLHRSSGQAIVTLSDVPRSVVAFPAQTLAGLKTWTSTIASAALPRRTWRPFTCPARTAYRAAYAILPFAPHSEWTECGPRGHGGFA